MSHKDDKNRDLVIHKAANGMLMGKVVHEVNGTQEAYMLAGEYETMHALAMAARRRGVTHFGGIALTDELLATLDRGAIVVQPDGDADESNAPAPPAPVDAADAAAGDAGDDPEIMRNLVSSVMDGGRLDGNILVTHQSGKQESRRLPGHLQVRVRVGHSCTCASVPLTCTARS